jgi:hypothetical protein
VRLRRPGMWLGLASALLVVAVVWSDRRRITPGAVSAVHARDPALAGAGCERCHGQGTGDKAWACTTCHEDIGAEVSERKGFHGKIASDPRNCAACHLEHHGPGFPLVGPQSFALAGVPERDRYDHAGLAFHLSGRHASLSCRECHKQADATLLPEGTKRFLGLAEACAGCHEDVHGGKLPDCATCHGQEHPFAKVANFTHTASFPLTGAHAAPGCLDCHPKGGPHAVEMVASGRAVPESPAPKNRACADCHESPHSPVFLAAAAKERGVDKNAACADCHPTSHTSFAGSQAVLTRAQHAATGFPLDAPHDKVSCEACHPTPRASFQEAYPGRKADDCRSCHADPHAGQFAQGRFAGQGCLACHARHAFEPAAFGLAAHAKTRFPLTGSHAGVPCARCHAETLPLPGQPGKLVRAFHGTSTACARCHLDAHKGFFDRQGFLSDAERARGCVLCHTSGSFAALAAPFDHARRTGFALEGAHAREDCAVCHPSSRKPDVLDRSFGRAKPGVAAASCHVCHADPHRGAFDRPGEPQIVQGRTDCARCHTTESFEDTRGRFDHKLWTGYALDGAHAKLSCESCHAVSSTSGAGARVLAPARGTDCAACHDDPHVGQFTQGGRTDCTRCHTTADTFQKVLFDHDTGSRFHLDEGHRKLACSACHVPFIVEGGGMAVRYKPLGTVCGDCHDARGSRPR